MIAALAAHKQDLEQELLERLQAFFAENDESPESISIEMKMFDSEQQASIHILVKDKL